MIIRANPFKNQVYPLLNPRFRPSDDFIFFEYLHAGNDPDELNCFGSFLIPLTCRGSGKYCEINFEPLRKPLETRLKIWQE